MPKALVYHGDKLTRRFWLRDPGSVPAPKNGPRGREIRGSAIWDLSKLRALLSSGDFDLDQLWFATRGARDDRDKHRWRVSTVAQMLLDLRDTEYRKSEWCEVEGETGMRFVPCDVYVMNYDLDQLQRDRHGSELYFKFSIDDDGVVTIVLASCHPST